ncbi:MAG: beta-phosphoglucomutase [Lachnospiraceae bacterium]|nr:beta-phosphoglucomutase [Lachnospiraceae bacterium]
MKYKGIIFDLDGVICSIDEYHYQAWKELADSINVYFDREINNRLRGVSRMESLEIILEKSSVNYSEEEKIEMAEKKNGIYKVLLGRMNTADLTNEVKSTLDGLRAAGLKLAIGSSSKNAKFILERIGLKDYFDAISDGTNISKSKPDPEVFLKAAEYLGLEPQECLVVEDAKAGIDAAVAGAFESAGLGEAASYDKATYPMDSFSALLDIAL